MNAPLQDVALDAVGQRYGIEVDQQADAAWAETEIGQKLRLVQRQDAFNRLEFQDHLAVYADVGDVAAVQVDIVINYGEQYLALERCTGPVELMAKAFFIDRFEQAGAEAAVNAHRQADDPVREIAAMGETGFHVSQAAVGCLDEALTRAVRGAVGRKGRITRITRINARITRIK